MLEENKTLLTLNIESNLLSGALVAEICRATLKNQTLIDLRLANQVSSNFFLFKNIYNFCFFWRSNDIDSSLNREHKF